MSTMTYEEQERQLAGATIRKYVPADEQRTVMHMLGLSEKVTEPKMFGGLRAQPQGVRGTGYAGRTPTRLASV